MENSRFSIRRSTSSDVRWVNGKSEATLTADLAARTFDITRTD